MSMDETSALFLLLATAGLALVLLTGAAARAIARSSSAPRIHISARLRLRALRIDLGYSARQETPAKTPP